MPHQRRESAVGTGSTWKRSGVSRRAIAWDCREGEGRAWGWPESTPCRVLAGGRPTDLAKWVSTNPWPSRWTCNRGGGEASAACGSQVGAVQRGESRRRGRLNGAHHFSWSQGRGEEEGHCAWRQAGSRGGHKQDNGVLGRGESGCQRSGHGCAKPGALATCAPALGSRGPQHRHVPPVLILHILLPHCAEG